MIIHFALDIYLVVRWLKTVGDLATGDGVMMLCDLRDRCHTCLNADLRDFSNDFHAHHLALDHPFPSLPPLMDLVADLLPSQPDGSPFSELLSRKECPSCIIRFSLDHAASVQSLRWNV